MRVTYVITYCTFCNLISFPSWYETFIVISQYLPPSFITSSFTHTLTFPFARSFDLNFISYFKLGLKTVFLGWISTRCRLNPYPFPFPTKTTTCVLKVLHSVKGKLTKLINNKKKHNHVTLKWEEQKRWEVKHDSAGISRTEERKEWRTLLLE